MENFKFGDRVNVRSKNTKGEIAFVGETHFSDGTWYGILLDEPKGRNNGTVDGRCYFKCPMNYGIFIRSSQIEKETVDDEERSNERNSVSSKITYRNYLKASSKLKTDKHFCQVKNMDHAQESGLEITENKIVEEGYESLKNEKDEELKNLRDENKDLEITLKNNELSLQDTLQKYAKATEEIKNLKDEIALKKQQINIQKCHLRLLKIKSNKRSDGKKAAGGSSLIEYIDDINFSDDDFDSESLKALTSMQRIVELEEENRIMIQGLIELKQFLDTCKLRLPNLNIANAENQQRQKGKRGNTDSFSEYCAFYPSGETNEPSVEESAQIKKYGDVLSELRKFNEIKKEKEIHFWDDDKMLQSQNEILQQSCADVDASTNLDISGLKKDSENFSNTLVKSNINDSQHNYKGAQSQYSQQSLNQFYKRMSKGRANFTDDKATPKLKNAGTELKQLIPAIAPNTGGVKQCTPLIPHEKRDLTFEKSSYPASRIAKSIDQPEALSSSNNLSNPTTQSSGGSACVKPTGKSLKRNVFSC